MQWYVAFNSCRDSRLYCVWRNARLEHIRTLNQMVVSSCVQQRCDIAKNAWMLILRMKFKNIAQGPIMRRFWLFISLFKH